MCNARKPPMLAPGFIILRGQQGVGKTSLAVSLLCSDYKYYNRQRRAAAEDLAQAYRRINGARLTIAPHLYFSNIRIELDPRRGVTTHYTDTQFLGLPNPDYSVQYFPPGSVVFIQEADTQLFNRNYKDTSDYVISLLKYVRHNRMTIVFDTQRDSALDKAVRSLATEVWHVLDSSFRRFLWFRPKYRWNYLVIRNQLNEALKELSELGVHIRLDTVRKASYKFRGDPFARYNSFSGQAYFLDGLTDYRYLPHPRMSIDTHDIAAYCAAHPLTKPKDTKKGKSDV